jgi:hypothetical protein
VPALLLELPWGAASPTAAEEEDDGGAPVGGAVALGVEDPQFELDVSDGLVEFGAGAREVRRIGQTGILLLRDSRCRQCDE